MHLKNTRISLCPARLTIVRHQCNIKVSEAAVVTGLTELQLRYIEDHTKRLDVTTWADIIVSFNRYGCLETPTKPDADLQVVDSGQASENGGQA